MTDDLDHLEALAEAATPGPWHWSGNTKTRQLYLATWIKGLGRVTVMAFRRWGTQSAKPQFIDAQMMLVDGDTLAEWEVCKTATSPDDPRLYRHDVTGIHHPDATFIAAANPDTVLALIERVRELERWKGTTGHRARDEVIALRKRAEAAEVQVARVRELAESWRYKGEFGWGSWQEGHGPDHEGMVLDDAARRLLAALDGAGVDE